MYITLNNDFKIDRVKNPTPESNPEITLNWITYVVQQGYKTGLTPDKRRLFNNIIDGVQDAVKRDLSHFEVNSVEHEFLKKAFELAVVDPKFVIPVTVVETALLNGVEVLSTEEAKN